jgi:CRISPR/Cas system-associated exonuclease Cas4 (RecB family)
MKNRWPLLTKDNESEYFKAASLAHLDTRDQAGGIGTQAHNIIEEYCNMWIFWGEKPETIKSFVKTGTDSRAVAAARSAEQAFINRKATPIASELLVGSEKVRVAGTLDLLVQVEDFLGFPELELWDWKSSNQVGEKFALQVATYRYLFEEMTKLRIARSRIMHLSKDTDTLVEYLIPNERLAFAAFKGICKAYDWKKNGKEKLVKVIKQNKWQKTS